jgi:hypothetical protein
MCILNRKLCFLKSDFKVVMVANFSSVLGKIYPFPLSFGDRQWLGLIVSLKFFGISITRFKLLKEKRYCNKVPK